MPGEQSVHIKASSNDLIDQSVGTLDMGGRQITGQKVGLNDAFPSGGNACVEFSADNRCLCCGYGIVTANIQRIAVPVGCFDSQILDSR